MGKKKKTISLEEATSGERMSEAEKELQALENLDINTHDKSIFDGKEVEVRAITNIKYSSKAGILAMIRPGQVVKLPEKIAEQLCVSCSAEYVNAPMAQHEAALKAEDENPGFSIPEELHVNGEEGKR